MHIEKGVLYVATGQKFVDEALSSRESLRASNPELSVSIVTDSKTRVPKGRFERVIVLDTAAFGFIDKIAGMLLTPYRLTIFLDTDTYIDGSLDPLYQMLERFDLGAALAPFREANQVDGLPDTFVEYNTGVVAYTDSLRVKTFLEKWLSSYQARVAVDQHDQPTFRESLYRSDLRIVTLPSEYNCRFRMGFAHGSVVVFHDRDPEITDVVARLNRHSSSKRVFRMTARGLEVFYPVNLEEGYSGRLVRTFKELVKALINRKP